MMAIVDQVGEEVLSDVVQEAFDEVRGRSSRKWAVALAALVLGIVIALIVVRLRGQRAAQGGGEPVSAPPSGGTTSTT